MCSFTMQNLEKNSVCKNETGGEPLAVAPGLPFFKKGKKYSNTLSIFKFSFSKIFAGENSDLDLFQIFLAYLLLL